MRHPHRGFSPAQTRRDRHGEEESRLLPLLSLKSCFCRYGSVGGDLCRAGFHMQPDAERSPPRVEYTILFSSLPAPREWDCGADREMCAFASAACKWFCSGEDRGEWGASLGAL